MTVPRRMPSAFVVLLVAALLLAACQPAAEPVATATPLPPSATATIAPTATVTAVPTATATPQPTPIPDGYHVLDWAGFSFVAPASWSPLDSNDSFLVLIDPKDKSFYMAVFASVNDETYTIDKIAADTVAIFEGKGATDIVTSDPVEVAVNGATSAQMIEIKRKSNLNNLIYRTYAVRSAQRDVLVIFAGTESTLKKKTLTLERIFDSLLITAPQPYGLPRAETLYQISGEPKPEDLDPAVSTSSAEDFTGLLFAGLVRLTPGMQIEPALAESWEIGGEGEIYTFTLRAGLKFADGSALTAQSVADSWERATNPELDSTTARTYLGDIQGVEEKLKGDAETISGLEVVDATTLKVTLLGARPYFLAKLTYPTAMVVDTRHIGNNSEWTWKANASGPFSIKEYKKGAAIIFERNPNYYQPAGVRYLLFSFTWGGTPKSLFEDGEIDILPIGSEDVLQVNKDDDPSHDQMIVTPAMCTTLVQVNTTLAPTDDPKVREALALAIDRDELNEVLNNNLALPAGTILPPAMPGYSADLDEILFDAGAAKQALQDSTYAGKDITLKVSVSGTAGKENPMISALAEMWKQHLGIRVQVVNLAPDDFIRAARENPGNLVMYGWCADYPDPENFLDLLYHTSSDFNVAAYANPSLDALLEKARTEPDVQQRLSFYRQVEETLLREYVSLPLFHGNSHVLVNPRVKNYVPAPLGIQQMQNITLEP